MLFHNTQMSIGNFTVNIVTVIDWNWFFSIILKLTNKRYMNYDDNLTYDLYVSYMSFIIIWVTNFEYVICCHIYHNYFEAIKKGYKTWFPLHLSRKQQTAKHWPMKGTFSAIVYLTTIIILYIWYICYLDVCYHYLCHTFQISDMLSFISHFSKQSKNDIKSHFQIWSTSGF